MQSRTVARGNQREATGGGLVLHIVHTLQTEGTPADLITPAIIMMCFTFWIQIAIAGGQGVSVRSTACL